MFVLGVEPKLPKVEEVLDCWPKPPPPKPPKDMMGDAAKQLLRCGEIQLSKGQRKNARDTHALGAGKSRVCRILPEMRRKRKIRKGKVSRIVEFEKPVPTVEAAPRPFPSRDGARLKAKSNKHLAARAKVRCWRQGPDFASPNFVGPSFSANHTTRPRPGQA